MKGKGDYLPTRRTLCGDDLPQPQGLDRSDRDQVGAAGIAPGAARDRLPFLGDAPDGGTAMTWTAEVRIAGPVGSMGQRVLQPIVNQQVSNVLDALEQQDRKITRLNSSHT